SSMSAMMTRAPSLVSWRAIPFPIPDAPPVTTATLPSRSGTALIGARSRRRGLRGLRGFPLPLSVADAGRRCKLNRDVGPVLNVQSAIQRVQAIVQRLKLRLECRGDLSLQDAEIPRN